jgi:hypothetical protein
MLMAKVYDLKTGQRKKVSRMEFFELLDTVEHYIEQLRPHRPQHDGLDKAVGIIVEMKFNGMFNPKFRDECSRPLEELLDDMYLEINS